MSQDEGAEDAALEAAPCELGEEAFHGVEPGRRSWGEVECPAGMSRKPSARYYGANATRGPPRAFGVLVGHLPSAILSLPAFVSRSPPDNSCMYPSWISRSLCSAGIVRCIKPLAQSRNETNSSWVNGADKSGFIFQICASGAAVQASHPATIKLTHYRAFRLDV